MPEGSQEAMLTTISAIIEVTISQGKSELEASCPARTGLSTEDLMKESLEEDDSLENQIGGNKIAEETRFRSCAVLLSAATSLRLLLYFCHESSRLGYAEAHRSRSAGSDHSARSLRAGLRRDYRRTPGQILRPQSRWLVARRSPAAARENFQGSAHQSGHRGIPLRDRGLTSISCLVASSRSPSVIPRSAATRNLLSSPIQEQSRFLSRLRRPRNDNRTDFSSTADPVGASRFPISRCNTSQISGLFGSHATLLEPP